MLRLAAPFVKLLQERCDRSLARSVEWASRFDWHPAEEKLARALLERHANLWVFRADQRARCGDFLLVDLSERRPERRRALALELKQGAPVGEASGGALWQLSALEEALEELRPLLGSEALRARVRLLSGDGAGVLAWLAASRRSPRGACG